MNTSTITNNIECIILAEFDIIEGSRIKHQFPKVTGVEKQVLAEFMLPDGAHNRDDDWTAFFLWRPTVKGKFRDSKFFDEVDEPVKRKFPVLNAYVHKFDSTATTAEWVSQSKSMAQVHLCSPIQIKVDGKPIHEIKQFDGLQFREMEETFIAVPSSFEVAYGYQFVTKEDSVKFTSFLNQMINNSVPVEHQLYPVVTKKTEQQRVPEEFLYCLSVMINKKDDSVTRGAIVKSLAVCSRYSFINIWRPFMLYSLEKYIKDQRIEILQELFTIINNIDIKQITSITPNESFLIRHSQQPKTVTLSVSFPEGRPIKVEAPLCFSNDEIGGESSTKYLHSKFGRQIIHIYNAILLEKKVLFVGYNIPSRDVCKCVLSALLMCSPPITDLVHRTFPIANLVLEEFHNLPGYIAGVTNPIFEQHADWWDVCCNLQTGKVTINSRLPTPFPSQQSEQADADFMDIFEYHISQDASDEALRSLFTKYTHEIIDVAFNERVYFDEEEKAYLTKVHLTRCGLWGPTPSYKMCQQEILMRPERSSIKGVDQRHIKKLRVRKDLKAEELVHILTVFEQNVKTEQQVIEFLTFFPENLGGLAPISLGLFHSSPKVRDITIRLLVKLDTNKFGHASLMNLGKYHQLAMKLARTPKPQPYLPGLPSETQQRPIGQPVSSFSPAQVRPQREGQGVVMIGRDRPNQK